MRNLISINSRGKPEWSRSNEIQRFLKKLSKLSENFFSNNYLII